jgi:predicted histone-like DNA-binding protein
MAINYSLGLRKTNPSDKSSEMKVYAYTQYQDVLDLDQLADHIQEHGSPFTADIIVGIARKLMSCIREQLLLGNKVRLGRLGAFYTTVVGEGVDDAEKFNPADHIKNVRVHWEPGKDFLNLIESAKFRYMATRKQQAQARKEEKVALNETMKDETTGDNTGGEGDITEGGDVTE